MTKIGCLILTTLYFLTPIAYGQSVSAAASKLHVFPQATDGRLSDGSSYLSMLWLDNAGSTTATCEILGTMASRFTTQTFSIPRETAMTLGSLDQAAFTSGVVQLSCSQQIFASLSYIFLSPRNTLMGVATVLPARGIIQAVQPHHLSGARFGVAIANIDSSTLNLDVRFFGANGMSAERTIIIPPSAQYVKFVDEILDLSTTTEDGVFVVANVQSSTPFYITGLMFMG